MELTIKKSLIFFFLLIELLEFKLKLLQFK